MDNNANKHLEMVQQELTNAKKKHPHFVDEVIFLGHDSTSCWLDQFRIILDNRSMMKVRDVESILICELYEALAAYTECDYEHAMQEFAQCAAVCIRAMEECEAKTTKKKIEVRNAKNERLGISDN